MNISRRSFLKMAGLTTVAAAGAAMFTGCSLYTTVKMQIVSTDGTVAANVLTKINKEAPEITIPSFVKEINGVLKNTVNDALQKAFKEANARLFLFLLKFGRLLQKLLTIFTKKATLKVE